MKYISYFENKSNIKLTIVDLTGNGDGIHALYINGKLHHYGDYYHDKIEIWIKGFIDGLKYINPNIVEEKLKIDNNNEWVYKTSKLADSPPDNLDDLFR